MASPSSKTRDARRRRARKPGKRSTKISTAMRRRIRTAADFFSHAIAIEREAVSRYVEFAQAMSDHGLDATARLFQRLARYEYQHLDSVLKKSAGMKLPELAPTEYAWVDSRSPEAGSHEFLFRLLAPYDALKIALEGERRARDFFERVLDSVDDPTVRKLAREYAREEQVHITWIERMLEQLPAPYKPADDSPLPSGLTP